MAKLAENNYSISFSSMCNPETNYNQCKFLIKLISHKMINYEYEEMIE